MQHDCLDKGGKQISSARDPSLRLKTGSGRDDASRGENLNDAAAMRFAPSKFGTYATLLSVPEASNKNA